MVRSWSICTLDLSPFWIKLNLEPIPLKTNQKPCETPDYLFVAPKLCLPCLFSYLFCCRGLTHHPAWHFEPVNWVSYLTGTCRSWSLGCIKRWRYMISAGWVATPNLSFLSAFRAVGHAMMIAYIMILSVQSACMLPHMLQAFSCSRGLSLPSSACFFQSCPSRILGLHFQSLQW